MSSIGEVPGVDAELDRGSALSPVEILVDVDGPRLFTVRTTAGEELLVYQYAEEPERFGWLVVPTDAAMIERLHAGQVSLLEALRQSWAWLVTQAFDGTIERVRRVQVDDLAAVSLPAAGVTLVTPEPPFLAVRATGPR